MDRVFTERRFVCRACGVEGVVLMPGDFAWSNFLPGLCDGCAAGVEAERRLAAMAADRVALVGRLVGDCGIPEGFRDWDDGKGNNGLRDWMMERRGRSVWISGKNGICKTRAVCLAGLRVMEEEARGVVFLNMVSWLREMMDLRRGDGGDVEMRRVFAAGVVILDDLGKGDMTSESRKSVLWELVEGLVVRQRRIWVTTNVASGEDLEKILGVVYGPGLVGRLRRVCEAWRG